MDLVIDCKASVETLGIYEVNNINACVKFYEFKNKSVIGTVLINGDYKKQSGELTTFENEVPFTIMSEETNIKINDLAIVDFQYYVIINQSIECLFDIKMSYEKFNNEVEDNFEIEEEDDFDAQEKEIEEKELHKNFNNNDELIENNESMEVDKIKDDIEKKYDEVLEEILLPRVDHFSSVDNEIDEKELLEMKKIEVSDLKKEDNHVNLRSIQDKYSIYRIYYLNEERNIDDVSKIENKSLDEILKYNKEYEQNKKIILK